MLFGGINKVIVDVKNLEKVDSSYISNGLMWTANILDDTMVFRDRDSMEVFVFDRYG